MLNFERLSNSYWIASLFGLTIGFSFSKALSGSSEFTIEALLLLLFSMLLMLPTYAFFKRHKRIIKDLLNMFAGKEGATTGKPTIKMFFQFARTPKEKFRALEVTYTLFWCGYFGLGMGLFLILVDYEKGLIFENKMHIIIGALLFLVLLAAKHLVFLWDVPYLEKLYAEKKRNSSDFSTDDVLESSSAEKVALSVKVKRGLVRRYALILLISLPGYWLAEMYLNYVRGNFTVEAGFDRYLFLLIIPTVFIVAINYFERSILWVKLNWFDLKGVDFMIPITMGLAVGYALSLALIRLGAMFVETLL